MVITGGPWRHLLISSSRWVVRGGVAWVAEVRVRGVAREGWWVAGIHVGVWVVDCPLLLLCLLLLPQHQRSGCGIRFRVERCVVCHLKNRNLNSKKLSRNFVHHLLVRYARVGVDDVLLLLVQDRVLLLVQDRDGLAQAEELLVEVVELHLQKQVSNES